MIGSGADRASQLAGQLALAKPTVSATVDTLVERGLVERGRRPTTAGSLTLTVTAARATTVLAGAEAAMRARLDDVLAASTIPTRCRARSPRCAAALDERRAERRRGGAGRRA